MKHEQPSTLSNLNDRQCWQAFKQGDHQAYARIYHQQCRALFTYGCQICSDREFVKDCIQDLFFYLWKRRDNLGDTDNIQYYLFKALRRSLISRLQKSQSTVLTAENGTPNQTTPSFEAQWIDEQMTFQRQMKLSSALNDLPKRQQEAIFLKYFHCLPSDDIADLMGINRRSVYKLISKALRRLKKKLSPSRKKNALK